MNGDPHNKNIEIIQSMHIYRYIYVTVICEHDVGTVPSINVTMIPIYVMMVSSELVYLYIGGTRIRKNSGTYNIASIYQ